MLSAIHSTVPGPLQDVQESLLNALANHSIHFADRPPSAIWYSIPSEVRSSIETNPRLDENQLMEAGGDALLGELMLDLLTRWCPDASTAFIKQAQTILTTNKTLGVLMELANPIIMTASDDDESTVSLIGTLRLRGNRLPIGVVKKRADQFEMTVHALFEEKGTVRSLQLLERCLKPIILYVITNLSMRKRERVSLTVISLPLKRFEDGDMKDVISQWAYEDVGIVEFHRVVDGKCPSRCGEVPTEDSSTVGEEQEQQGSSDDGSNGARSGVKIEDTLAVPVTEDADEDELETLNARTRCLGESQDYEDFSSWGEPPEFEPNFVSPKGLGRLLLEASREIRRKKGLRMTSISSTSSITNNLVDSSPASLLSSSSAPSLSTASSMSIVPSLSSSTSVSASSSLSAFAALTPSSSTSAFSVLSRSTSEPLSLAPITSLRSKRDVDIVSADGFSETTGHGKRKRTPSSGSPEKSSLPRKMRPSGTKAQHDATVATPTY